MFNCSVLNIWRVCWLQWAVWPMLSMGWRRMLAIQGWAINGFSGYGLGWSSSFLLQEGPYLSGLLMVRMVTFMTRPCWRTFVTKSDFTRKDCTQVRNWKISDADAPSNFKTFQGKGRSCKQKWLHLEITPQDKLIAETIPVVHFHYRTPGVCP